MLLLPFLYSFLQILNKIAPNYNQKSPQFEQMEQDKNSNVSTQAQNGIESQNSSIIGRRGGYKKWKKVNKTTFTMKRPSKSQLFNASVWSQLQNNAYRQFLIQNMAIFALSKLQRRDIKINVLISKAVKTRTPDQCRSHHQKMMKYHGNLPAIVAFIASNEDRLNREPAVDSCYMGDSELKDLMLNEVDFEQESFCQELMRIGEIHF